MIVDVNVNLSRWPFRRLPHDETSRLVKKLQQCGVSQAWAGSFDGVLHRDIADVNRRLSEDCRRHGDGLLLPVGSVNPSLPDWEEDVRRCAEDHRMKVIRLHPNYHGYGFDSDLCDQLLAEAQRFRLIVQVALKMEDVRTNHPLMVVPTVDATPLAALVKRHPNVPLIVMNNYGSVRGDAAAQLAEAGNVYFENSHAEQVGALEKLTKDVPLERLLFGSHFPFFNLEASLFKFRESALGGAITEAIQHKNAEELLGDR
ncbi:MAG: amidohydrolase family protein [Planctomycetes bacterium]|nr:amidohydrolase family protein [Planctomycetota bacterium]